ncbi:C40 family peptidase [Actinoplanes sp. URMC 104]|uniref:C40 family peptidase n=1 Tax=Actinoplanes sp. URMC 104 TaxID=3423409 RepID=UPI003F1CD1FD
MLFPTLRRLLLLVAATAIATTLLVTPSAAQAASAAPAAAAPAARAAAAGAAAARGVRIVAAASAQRGKPYRYGAAGPGAFDCSGLAGYSYAKVGLRLPRTAQAQYRTARAVPKAAARPGDLVFWVSGGHAYHVGVYAGAGRVWHAPKPGDRVRLAPIWSWSQVRFGRVGT